MEKFFRIKSVKEENKLNVGDEFYFYEKSRFISAISNNWVTFACGNKFPSRLFAKWVRMDDTITKAHNQSLSDRIKNKTQEVKVFNKPSNALRYIILQNLESEEYAWNFADRYTSHSQLETDYNLIHGNIWSAVSGGFYCFRTANAVASYDEDYKLELFGKSDSYGLNPEAYIQAKKILIKTLQPDIIIDDSWVKKYFLDNYKTEI